MKEKKVLPHFETEAEEALWWADHQDELADVLNGDLGTKMNPAEELELPPIDEAKRQAREATKRFGKKSL